MNHLKDAEKKSTQMVQDARKARGERIKEAKVEAEAIIAAYRAEMEAKFQVSVARQSGSSGAAGNELDKTTVGDLAQLNRDFATRKAAVEELLMEKTLKVVINAPKSRA